MLLVILTFQRKMVLLIRIVNWFVLTNFARWICWRFLVQFILSYF